MWDFILEFKSLLDFIFELKSILDFIFEFRSTWISIFWVQIHFGFKPNLESAFGLNLVQAQFGFYFWVQIQFGFKCSEFKSIFDFVCEFKSN